MTQPDETGEGNRRRVLDPQALQEPQHALIEEGGVQTSFEHGAGVVCMWCPCPRA